ncbi:MAG: HAD family hydrolase [Gemmataceae bacterium]
MALDALIFDIDGTLIDTNAYHVEAWQKAFASLGHQVPAERIAVEIGKGGDLLVPSILGQEANREQGEALRKAHADEFGKIAEKNRFKVFPGVVPLFAELHKRGISTALATSSSKKHLDAIAKSARLDLEALADVLITADDAQTSKPFPDLVLAALHKLRLTARQCAMVGDTPYDAEACRRAGVVCLGVLSGGNSEETLRAAGAKAVWKDAADLLAHLDQALAIAMQP